MGHLVTIEGSLTPSVHLARGERRTVAVTDTIRQLVRIGAVIVVEGSLDTPDAGESATAPESAPVEPESSTEPDAPADTGQLVPDEPPARNAGRDDWAEWVAAKMPDAVTEGASRDELRDMWAEFNGQR